VPVKLDMRILGPLEARRNGTILELGGRKQRTVLGVLLLSPNEVVSVDRLIQAVWGEDAAPSTRRTLQVYLSKLRTALDPKRDAPELIATVAPGYRFAAESANLDLLRFESMVEEARGHAAVGQAREAVELYRQALGMWRGPLLADLTGSSTVIDLEADRIELTRMAVIADRIDAELALGHHAEVLAEIDGFVKQNPLDERLRGQLMIALYRVGRHADALGTYNEIRRHLDEELGLEPGSALKRLEEQVLLHDSDLLEPDVAPPGTTITIERSRQATKPAWLVTDGEKHNLDRAVTTIGRLPDRTIALTDPTVSRRHAEIRRVGSRFALVDVGSMNGITVNGRAVLEHDLESGDVVNVGAVEFVFQADD
jgi:DNA-binding SARP family transcriptional activator